MNAIPIKKGERPMVYEILARERVEETLREAEKARLIEMVKTSLEDWTKRFLTVFFCRLGRIPAC